MQDAASLKSLDCPELKHSAQEQDLPLRYCSEQDGETKTALMAETFEHGNVVTVW